MKKITAYTWAFILLIATFLVAGLFTLGSAKTTGDALTVEPEKSVAYSMTLESGEKLDAVYINVGAIHTEVGKDATITVKTSTTTSGNVSWTTMSKAIKLGNVMSEAGQAGANYNWVKYAAGQNKGSVKKVSFTSNVYLDLNEIVCLNTDGEIIELTPYVAGSAYTFDEVSATIDRQENFSLDNSANANFTQEEGYYMSSVHNVLGGKTLYSGAKFVLDSNFNYLATLLTAPSVALFGDSVFALRLPAFLATCAILVFAYLLVCELTKKDKVAFYFALVLAIGGMVTTVGRLGAPYTMVVSALLASAYFMYRFFAHGISSQHVVKGGMNILVSGLFAAVAMSMDLTAIIPVIGILVLFVFGLRRQKRAFQIALEKTSGKESAMVDEDGETVYVNKAAERAYSEYADKTRVSYGFAALSFGMATIVILLLATVFAYSAYMKSVENQATSFLVILWNGLKGSVRESGVSSFAATNAMNVLGWWLPLKPATLYAGVTSAAAGEYVGWHVLPNAAVSVLSFLAFIGATVKVVLDFVKKADDKKTLRFRRMYFFLLSGMVLAMAAGLLRGNVSAISGLLFHVLYVGFLPLVATLLPEGDTREEKTLVNVVIWAVVAVIAVLFILNVPAMYGTVTTVSRAKWFNWASLWNNLFFR